MFKIFIHELIEFLRDFALVLVTCFIMLYGFGLIKIYMTKTSVELCLQLDNPKPDEQSVLGVP